jgi:uncharacterized membrane protein
MVEREKVMERVVMDHKTLSGAVLAAAVGAIFLSMPTFAQNTPGKSDTGKAQVKCVGGNSCKGQSACNTASSSCMGQNSCKGKGWIVTSSPDQCTAKGGHPEKPRKM